MKYLNNCIFVIPYMYIYWFWWCLEYKTKCCVNEKELASCFCLMKVIPTTIPLPWLNLLITSNEISSASPKEQKWNKFLFVWFNLSVNYRDRDSTLNKSICIKQLIHCIELNYFLLQNQNPFEIFSCRFLVSAGWKFGLLSERRQSKFSALTSLTGTSHALSYI